MTKFEVRGEQLVKKIVVKHGTGGMVYCPKAWIGKEVVIILGGK